MSIPTYKNTNEMPIKQTTMISNQASSKVSSKVKIIHNELQALEKELQDIEGLRNENQAMKKDAITGYQGIRIDSHGRKFLITNARIWTIWNEQDIPYGQAATFSKWKRF